jgi:hypothetical protein
VALMVLCVTCHVLCVMVLCVMWHLRGVSTNKTIIYFIAMQTYKELIT